ncbi:MAG: DUF1800 family protein, partial [Acidobacteria bacterium]|nr:DUF1800 family protein [Acidobacteriota bacterium]
RTETQKAPGAVPAAADTATVAHVLSRLAYGPRQGDIARVQQMTLAAYIDGQLHPERIADVALQAKLAAFPTINLSTKEIARDYYGPAEALRRAEQRAVDPMMAGQPPQRPGSATSRPNSGPRGRRNNRFCRT